LLLVAVGLVSCDEPATRPAAPAPRVTNFVIEVDPSSGSASVTARGLSVEANLVQNNRTGIGPVDSFELVTTNVRLPGVGDCIAGQNCFDVTARSFYDTESFDNVYMQIDEIDPPTGRTMANSDGPPLNSGLTSPFGGRNFDTVGPGQAVLRDVRITVPGLERYIVRGRLFHDAVGAQPTCPTVASCRLFVGNAFAPQLYTLNPSNAVITSTLSVTMPTFTVDGILALDNHPTTGQLYAVIKTRPSAGGANRSLAIIDKTTGVATRIGPLGDAVASIAFNGDGSLLYAAIGERSANPLALRTINITNATLGPVLTSFGNGDDGESIGFNPYDGLVYHTSGISLGDQYFETVDPSRGFALNVITSSLAQEREEILGLGFNPDTGGFFATGLTQNLYLISRTASVSFVGFIPKLGTVMRDPTLSP